MHSDTEMSDPSSARSILHGLYCGLGWLDPGHLLLSEVVGIFTSGATAALIRESFPNQKGVVVSETAPMSEDLLDIRTSGGVSVCR